MASITKIFHHSEYPTISASNPANDQTGRTVLIMGAASGIGYAIAGAFIQAKASEVILTGYRQETLQRAAVALTETARTTTVRSYVCDLNDGASIKELWRRLADDHVQVNTLILNAADSASGPILPISSFLPQLRGAFDKNLFANISMVDYFFESTKDQTPVLPKVVINIASFMAHSNPAPFQAAYSTSKAAFAHILQRLADETTTDEYQIVNVHPGAILTQAASNAPQPVLDAVAWDNVDLPASFVVWASTKHAAFLHGHFVWANWDVDEMLTWKSKFEDPGFLKLGLQGAEHVDIRTIFDKIRQGDAKIGEISSEV